MTTTYTPEFSSHLLLESIQHGLTDAEHPTYVYAALGLANNSIANDSVLDKSVKFMYGVLSSFLFGKKVQASDVRVLVNRNTWVTGTVYAMYDDTDMALEGKNFYVINSSRRVYKCLFNNNGGASTVQPTASDGAPFELADGYVWKYLFRLSEDDLNNYSTTTLIPIVADNNTTANAVYGSIDFVNVEDPGAGYNGTFEGTILQVVSPTVLRITSDAPAVQGWFTDSDMYLVSGPGAGGLSLISNYISNASGRFVQTLTPLANASISSTFSITPHISFDGDGSQAVGRVIIANNQVVSIDMLQAGSNYTYATAEISANATTYTQPALVRPILPPIGGHGSDVPSELFARNLLITTIFDGSESGLIPANVNFSRVGLLTNAKQASNTSLTYTENTFDATARLITNQINGNFQLGDIVSNPAGTEGYVLAATSNTAVIDYTARTQFALNDIITSRSGVSAAILDIRQPEIYPYDCKVLSIKAINTIERAEASQENISLILRV